ncbi:MAG: hypothetical protein OEM52_07140, partial [bacterium]|nr:hypothetical protein [bacterium]
MCRVSTICKYGLLVLTIIALLLPIVAVEAQDSLNVIKFGGIVYPTGTENCRDLVIQGNYAYITCSGVGTPSRGGVSIVDISNFRAPVEVAFIEHRYAAGIVVQGDLLCVGIALYSNNFFTYNISNPLSPVLLGSANIGHGVRMAIQGNFVYVAEAGFGIGVIDVSNPATPVLRGTNRLGDVSNDVVVDGNYAYVTDGHQGVQIVDVSNPDNLVVVGRAPVTHSGYYRNLTKNGNRVYVADNWQGLHIVDVSNPTSPSEIGFYHINQEGAHDVTVEFPFCYVGTHHIGIRVFDVSNPASIVDVGHYTSAGHTQYGMFVRNRVVYSSEIERFTVYGHTPFPLFVTHPTGGENLLVGRADSVTWSQTVASTGNVFIEMDVNYPSGNWLPLGSATASAQRFDWIPQSQHRTTNGRIRVLSQTNPQIGDTSGADFVIYGDYFYTDNFNDGNFSTNLTWNVLNQGQPGTVNILQTGGRFGTPGLEMYCNNVDGWGTMLYTPVSLPSEFIAEFWFHKRVPTFSIPHLGFSQGIPSVIPNNLGFNTKINFNNQTNLWELILYNNSTVLNTTVVIYPDRWVKLRMQRFANGVWTVTWDADGENQLSRNGNDNLTNLSDLSLFLTPNGYYDILGGFIVDDITIRGSRMIDVVSPNGNDTRFVGYAETIYWSSLGNTGNVSIELDRNYPSDSWETIETSTIDDGEFVWTPSQPTTNHARIRIRSVVNTVIGDTSDADFSVYMPILSTNREIVAFGQIRQKTTDSLLVSISNPYGQPFTFQTTSLDFGAQFSIRISNTLQTISPNDSLWIWVKFLPDSLFEYIDTLRVTFETPYQAVTIPLEGTGVGKHVYLATSSLSFTNPLEPTPIDMD